MARASVEKKVLAMTCTDPRLQIVGHATAHVWLRLVMLIWELGTDGVLRFGSGLGFAFGSANEIARLLHIGETEWETELETLVGRGLLQRDASGALELPERLGMSAQAKAARINGMRGGRPRKDGSPPRQRHLLLPMEGGQGEKPMETEHQTQPAAADPKLKLDAEVSLQAQAQLVPDADFHRVGRAAFEAAGFNPAKDMPNYGIVRQWLADRPAWMSVEQRR